MVYTQFNSKQISTQPFLIVSNKIKKKYSFLTIIVLYKTPCIYADAYQNLSLKIPIATKTKYFNKKKILLFSIHTNSEHNHLLQRHYFNFYNLKTSLKLFFIKISLKKKIKKKQTNKTKMMRKKSTI